MFLSRRITYVKRLGGTCVDIQGSPERDDTGPRLRCHAPTADDSIPRFTVDMPRCHVESDPFEEFASLPGASSESAVIPWSF